MHPTLYKDVIIYPWQMCDGQHVTLADICG